ncbi:MAG: hypothetical protein H6918_10710 [Sphingomonadaceae bacterium]|nr:hypothetical protein [Sphingomonadaceae bacterium]
MNIRRILVATSCFAIACCSPAPEPAPVAPPPVSKPSPTPAPAPALAPVKENWMDMARTPGDWRYADAGARSHAAYGAPGGTPIFVIGCDKAARQVHLIRAGAAQGRVPMRVLSETADRMLDAQASSGSTGMVQATLPAGDPLLDAIAFSKGRFAVEVPGMDTLYLPSWTEVSRVVEDCR